MSNVLFFHVDPDIARAETRDITLEAVPGVPSESDIPVGRYAFLENYCIDPGCDCRRVLFSVTSQNTRQVVATISHAFEKPEPDKFVSVQTFLDPLMPQSPFAPEMMDVFLTQVLDPVYAARLERHYQLTKEAGRNPDHPIHQKIREQRLLARRRKTWKTGRRGGGNKRGRR